MGRPSTSSSTPHPQAGAKHSLQHRAMLNSVSKRSGKLIKDYGLENFTYDPENVSKWQMPNHINAKELPKALCAAAKDWTLAGAAVDTSLERTQVLFDEAVNHAFPRYTHEHFFNFKKQPEQCRSVDDVSEPSLVHSGASTVASTPATSFCTSDPPSSPPKLDIAITNKPRKYVDPNRLPEAITSKPGMESPPYSPNTLCGSESGSGAQSPTQVVQDQATTDGVPDPNKLSAQLSPLVSPSSGSLTSSSSSGSNGREPDILSWSNYIAACEAELDGLQTKDLSRLRGYAYTIQKVLFQLRSEPPKDLTWQTAETVVAFAGWWKEAQNQGKEREQTVAALELPTLELVVAALRPINNRAGNFPAPHGSAPDFLKGRPKDVEAWHSD